MYISWPCSVSFWQKASSNTKGFTVVKKTFLAANDIPLGPLSPRGPEGPSLPSLPSLPGSKK